MKNSVVTTITHIIESPPIHVFFLQVDLAHTVYTILCPPLLPNKNSFQIQVTHFLDAHHSFKGLLSLMLPFLCCGLFSLLLAILICNWQAIPKSLLN